MCDKDNPYKPHKVKIVKVTDETLDTKTYTVRFTDEEIRDTYTFEPGQFNMLTIFGIGEAPVSISSLQGSDGYYDHTIREVGNVTNAIAKLGVGDTFRLRGPYGNGWPLDLMKGKNILLISGGIGLAPLRPVIHSIAKERDSYGKLEILYGARTPEDGLFRREYPNWESMPETKLRLIVDKVPEGSSWNQSVGVVTELFRSMDSSPDNTVVAICGPEIMMKFALKDLIKMGFSEEQIFLSLERRMNCGISKCGFCQIGPKFVCHDGPVFSYNELTNLTERIL